MHFSKNKSSNRLKYSDTLKYQIQIYIFRYAVVGCVVDGLVDAVVDGLVDGLVDVLVV